MPRPPRPPQSTRAFALAVGLHVVVGAVLLRLLTFGHGIPSWLDFGGEKAPFEERLRMVETPRSEPKRQATSVPRRPAATRPPAEAPAGAAGAVTPPAESTPRDTGSGGAPARGVGDLDPNVRGVRPGYTDERVWRGPVGGGGAVGGAEVASGDRADKLDSIMAGILTAARDSLDSIARAQGKYGRQPGDWTKTGKNGEKWGWDQRGIRLGKVTIPNALLALLPLNSATAVNMSGNMARMDADRRLAASRADIQRMSERGLGEAEFRRVLKTMDARRDAERRERLRSPSASLAAPVKSSDKSADKPSDR